MAKRIRSKSKRIRSSKRKNTRKRRNTRRRVSRRMSRRLSPRRRRLVGAGSGSNPYIGEHYRSFGTNPVQRRLTSRLGPGECGKEYYF